MWPRSYARHRLTSPGAAQDDLLRALVVVPVTYWEKSIKDNYASRHMLLPVQPGRYVLHLKRQDAIKHCYKRWFLLPNSCAIWIHTMYKAFLFKMNIHKYPVDRFFISILFSNFYCIFLCFNQTTQCKKMSLLESLLVHLKMCHLQYIIMPSSLKHIKCLRWYLVKMSTQIKILPQK